MPNSLFSEIRADQVPGDRFKERRGSVRLGSQTLSQIHGLQSESLLSPLGDSSLS